MLLTLSLAVAFVSSDTTVLRRADCAACRIETVLVREVRNVDLPLAAGSQQVLRHRSGRLLLLDDAYKLGPVFVDSTNRITPLTRGGEGPGEWRAPAAAWTLGADSFAIYDERLRRITAYDWSGRPGRTQDAPNVTGGLRLPDNTLLLSGYSGAKGAMGATYFVYGPSGFVRAWAETDRRVVPGTLPLRGRLLAQTPHGIWAIPQYRSTTLERRALDGTLQGTYRLEAPWVWIRPSGSPVDARQPVRPSTHARAIATRDSLVFVLFETADPRWRSTMTRQASPDGPIYVPATVEAMYDHWLVVLDARSGRLIILRKLSGLWHSLSESGDLIRVRGDGDETVLELYRILLTSTS